MSSLRRNAGSAEVTTLLPSWSRPKRALTANELASLEDFERWWSSDRNISYHYNQKYIMKAAWMAARGFTL